MMKTRFSPLSSIIQTGSACALIIGLTGCASLGKNLKAWISGKEADPPAPKISTPRYSEQENLHAGTDRQYKRMNRARFEDESELKADAGSLWVMEGQGAYLFSQNQMRMVGDLLNVKIEGAPKSQLQTKARVIQKLLERLENPNRGIASVAAPAPDAAAANPNAKPTDKADPNAASAANSGTAPGAASATEAKVETPFNVQLVPTRIVEQTKDGNYRVRGMHPFMIGKREYKVIVTGLVRAEDFDDAGIDSSKLVDSQFDIVSSRKGASL